MNNGLFFSREGDRRSFNELMFAEFLSKAKEQNHADMEMTDNQKYNLQNSISRLA